MDRQGPAAPYQALDYYRWEGALGAAAPRRERRFGSFLGPCLYVLLGVLFGWVAATGAPPVVGRTEGVAQFRWLRSPARWWGHRGEAATQLFDAAQTSKFLQLRQRIDEEFDSRLNTADTEAAVDYSPFHLSFELLARIDEEFDRFLQDLTAAGPPAGAAAAGRAARPAFDVQDTAGELRVTCTVPGLKPEQMSVDLQGQLLLVTVQDVREDETSHMETHFSRGFVVPEGVAPKDVTATVEGDALRVVVRKPGAAAEAAELPQAILIQTYDA